MAASETLSVQLPSDLADELRRAVEAGEYTDVDAAVVDALTAWSRRVEDREEALDEIRVMVMAALHDPEPLMTLSEVDAHLEAFFASVEASRSDEAA